MSFFLDFKSFNEGLKKLDKDMKKKAETGIFDAGNMMLKDAREKIPKAPKATGDLHKSGIVSDIEITGKSFTITVGFNISYAARWHELPEDKASKINWTLPGSGPKFLEKKMIEKKEKYIWMIGESIKRALESK